MYARSTTINADPGAVDAGIAYIRDEVMPAITAMKGCVGLSMVVDRETGRCIATSSWDSEDAMHATDDALAAYRSRAAEILGGAAAVEEWEVAVMHRDHASAVGACCRITWARPRDLDATVERWRTSLLRQIEAMDGFCSASMLVDRTRGLSCGTVTFDTRAALEASRRPAAELRQRAATELGVEFLDIAEFDLALAHLRVPELV
jgi:quinol monooxygenase YgiN